MSETKHATAAEPRDTAATLRADYEQMRSEAQGKPLTVAGRANLFGIADRAIAALAACERERDEAREVVAKVNNSFGSYSYHTNPHPADEVEKVKRDYREQWQRANAANARADAALAQVAALRDSMEEMAIIFRNYYAQAIPRSRVEDMLEKYAALRRDTSHAADQLAARDARVRGEERERVAARLEAIAAMGEFNAAAALVDLQRELAKEPKT